MNDYEYLQQNLAKRTVKEIIFCIIYVVFFTALLLCGPIYAFFYKNQYSNPTGVIIPFIDPDSLNGFLINCFIQTIVGFAGATALVGNEIMLYIGDSNLFTMKELIKYNLKKIDENILSGKSSLELGQEFKHLFKMLEDVKQYINYFNELFYFKAFFQPTFTTVLVAVAILCQYVVNFIDFCS